MRRMMNQAHANDGPDNHSEVAAQRIADLASNMRTVKNTEVMNDLGPTFQPGPCDVICARGKSAFQHEGNQRFRAIIEQRMEQYASAANKFEKSVIVSQVVDEIRQASPQGGFVRSDKGRWYEVGDHIAREKVGQSFRDLLHAKYRSSTKAKKLRKQNSRILSSPNEEGAPSETTSDGIPEEVLAQGQEHAMIGAGGTLYLSSNPSLGNQALSVLEPIASSEAATAAEPADSAFEPLDAFQGSNRLSGNIQQPDLSFLMRVLHDGGSAQPEQPRSNGDDSNSRDV